MLMFLLQGDFHWKIIIISLFCSKYFHFFKWAFTSHSTFERSFRLAADSRPFWEHRREEKNVISTKSREISGGISFMIQAELMCNAGRRKDHGPGASVPQRTSSTFKWLESWACV